MKKDLFVFCGPSITPAEASRRTGGIALGPARQGDIFRVLSRQPRAIALIDGVFESVPSVWHRELIAAIDAGVALFGASSMGALRAAELERYGMIGVGTVFGWVRAGIVDDDADVALIHALEDQDFRPITVPLVTVRHAVERARREKRATPKQAAALLRRAESLHYQDRTWGQLLNVLAPDDPLGAWLRDEAPDIKRLDALDCLDAAAAFVRANAPPAPKPRVRLPAHVRRRRILQTPSYVGAQEVDAETVMGQLGAVDGVAGMRRLLLAGWATSLGIVPTESELLAERRAWLREQRLSPEELPRFLEQSALDEGQLDTLLEARALERLMVEHAERLVPDGPAWIEGVTGEAKLSGAWAEAARALAGAARPRPRTPPTRSKKRSRRT